MLINEAAIAEIRNADLIAFLERYHGFTFAHRSGAYRCIEHPSLAVKGDRLSWYWHSKGFGGYGVLDFLMKAEGMAFRDAVETVEPCACIKAAPAYQRKKPEPPKTLMLPEKAESVQRLYEYLCGKRGIDAAVVDALVDEGKLYGDIRGNVVFVGFDSDGTPRFGCLRGTRDGSSYRRDCAGSDKRCGFSMMYSQSACLYVFESPIDAMSHASIINIEAENSNAWKGYNRLSLAGTADTALSKALEAHRYINELVFCLDNDPAGRSAAMSLSGKYAAKGVTTRLELPTLKDYNEDLLKIRKG